jgi:uncharacterized membrane protein
MKHCNPEKRPQTVEQLTRQNVETVSKLETATKAGSSVTDRIADRISRFCGSMGFVYFHVAWFASWVLINTGLPTRFHFDGYPFSFLTLVVSLEAIFLSAFILIAQNRQGVLSERRAQLDLQINMLSEQENTKMLCLLQQIAKSLGVNHGSDHEIELLAKAVKPEELARQIEESAKVKRQTHA